jgi:hypothetical protein
MTYEKAIKLKTTGKAMCAGAITAFVMVLVLDYAGFITMNTPMGLGYWGGALSALITGGSLVFLSRHHSDPEYHKMLRQMKIAPRNVLLTFLIAMPLSHRRRISRDLQSMHGVELSTNEKKPGYAAMRKNIRAMGRLDFALFLTTLEPEERQYLILQLPSILGCNWEGISFNNAGALHRMLESFDSLDALKRSVPLDETMRKMFFEEAMADFRTAMLTKNPDANIPLKA